MAKPESNLRIGEFIIQKLAVSKDKVSEILNVQQYLHEKIGEIAILKKIITKKELDKILSYQKKYRTSFGNEAISLGFMKIEHIKYLLDLQTTNAQRLGELLVEQGIIKQEEFLKLLDQFFAKRSLRFNVLAYVDETLRKEIEQAVRPYQYKFFSFFSSCSKEDLFSLIEKHKPQLILLDQKQESVEELALEINRIVFPKPVKVALFTPDKRRSELLRGYQCGIDYILPMPFDLKHLINIIIDTEAKCSEKRKERILIVDDSPIVRESIARELSEKGYQLLFAKNGKEAVEIAALEKPDLITMDINMPEMNGYEACSVLKKHPFLGKVPIIIVTTNTEWEEIEKGFEVGATEYITKPFSKGHLSNYIEHLLSTKKTRPEKILIAEDSPMCKHLYDGILTKYGFQIEIVDNGEEVFEALERGFDPSIILLDIFMPVMDGFETCIKLKGSSKYSHIPVIMITASKKKDVWLQGLKSGTDDYIIKPFHEGELITRVQTYIQNFTLLKNMKNKTALIGLLQEITVTTNEASTAEEAIQVCLDKICGYLGWPIGHMYIVDSKRKLIPSKLWYMENLQRFETFRKVSEDTPLDPGVGLPGRVLASGKPAWIEDVTNDQNFPRAKLAREIGVKAAFGLPVLEREKVVAVLEFFSEEAMEHDDLLLEALSNLAIQLGRVTERKREEEERQKMEEKLRETQKLESLGVLAGGIAHDFNNILTGILGNSDLAFDDLSPASPTRNYIGKIQEEAKRAAELCHLMLAYSGKGKFVIENIDVNEIIKDVTHMLEVSISKRHVIKNDLTANLPFVDVDITQIRQVIMNLIINASEAIGENNGVISASTSTVECGSEGGAAWKGMVLNEVPLIGQYVVIEVTDTGVGMDKNTIKKIFDPFFTTKFTGRGLGMSAILGIIRGHKGAINVESEPGKGTKFTVFLPASRETSSTEKLDSKETEAPWQGTGTVLVVDDEETVRGVAKSMLGKMGFKVIMAADGKEAVEILRDRSNEIDYIILDLTMPRMSGEECFLELRKIREDIPIVICSGYSEEETAKKFVDQRVNEFLQKPFRLKTLKNKMRKVFDRN